MMIVDAIKRGFKKVTGKGLSPLILIAGGVLVIIFFKKMFSSGGVFGNLLGAVTQPGNAKSREDFDESMGAISVVTKQLSKSEYALKGVANQQDAAMRGWGTNRDLLFTSISGLNTEDLKYVYKSFGVREESLFGITTFFGDLFGWYSADLSASDLALMKEKWSATGLWH